MLYWISKMNNYLLIKYLQFTVFKIITVYSNMSNVEKNVKIISFMTIAKIENKGFLNYQLKNNVFVICLQHSITN